MNDFQLVNPENPDLCDPSKSQWYLSEALAERIVQWATDRETEGGMRVIEPSAGRGAIVRALQRCALIDRITAVELDPDNAAALDQSAVKVIVGDFLKTRALPNHYDLAVMNPPFEGGQTERHIMHALKFSKVVVCHCPLTTLAGLSRQEWLWSQVSMPRMVIHSGRPKYSGSKTVGQTDMMTIEVVPQLGDGARVATEIEWWV